MADDDIITPEARRVLDALGHSGAIIEWRPELSSDERFVVVFGNETAARITVEPIPDPGPLDPEDLD